MSGAGRAAVESEEQATFEDLGNLTTFDCGARNLLTIRELSGRLKRLWAAVSGLPAVKIATARMRRYRAEGKRDGALIVKGETKRRLDSRVRAGVSEEVVMTLLGHRTWSMFDRDDIVGHAGPVSER